MARRKKQDEEEQENINNESDDSFGLPEVEYQPLNREEPPTTTIETEETTYTSSTSTSEPEPEPVREEYVEREEEVIEEREPEYDDSQPSYVEEEEESSPIWPKVLIAILILAVVGAIGYYLAFYRPQQLAKEEQAKKEQLAREAEAARKEADRIAALKREEDEKRRADSLANLKPAAGTIEALSERTGRYYVVVASAIDDDLIHDHAVKLSKAGVTCWIIPPFGKTKFSRLAVDYKDNYTDAQATADGMKGGDYGNDIWVVKY
jgi:hypothetical protein